MKKISFLIRSMPVILLITALVGCNIPTDEDSSPTLGVTQAYQTVEARLTQAAIQTLIDTPQPSSTATETLKETPSSVAATPTKTSQETTNPTATTSLCDQAAAGNPIDVTIPDDTTMQPAQAFTKTWRLVNAGTCTWTKNYTIALFSGEAMSAPGSVALPQKVDPGQNVDISVDMIAPQTPGTYQGNWKLRNASSTWFGIGPEGGSPFWVRIIVAPQTLTVTATLSPTPSTPSPTGTPPTPTISEGGAMALIPGDRINLDTLQLNPGTGEDLGYLPNDAKKLTLAPLGNAQMAIFGSSSPSLENCQAAAFSKTPLLVRDLSSGLFLCHRTDQGLYGWVRLLNWDPKGYTLIIQAFTWTLP